LEQLGRNSIFPSLHRFSIIAPFAVREMYYCTLKTGVILVLLRMMMLMRDDSDMYSKGKDHPKTGHEITVWE